jgi:hypothetical protein
MAKKIMFLVMMGAALQFILPGCSMDAHLTSSPSLDEDFLLPPDEMRRRFYDLDRYEERTVPVFAMDEMPPQIDLQRGRFMGPPESNNWSFWNLCPFFMYPIPLCPVKTKVWVRGHYEFEVKIAYPMFYRFKPSVWYWDVVEMP